MNKKLCEQCQWPSKKFYLFKTETIYLFVRKLFSMDMHSRHSVQHTGVALVWKIFPEKNIPPVKNSCYQKLFIHQSITYRATFHIIYTNRSWSREIDYIGHAELLWYKKVHMKTINSKNSKLTESQNVSILINVKVINYAAKNEHFSFGHQKSKRHLFLKWHRKTC